MLAVEMRFIPSENSFVAGILIFQKLGTRKSLGFKVKVSF